MKAKITAVLALCALVAFGAEVKVKKHLTPEEQARTKLRMQQKTGGLIHLPGKGKLIFLNAQSRVPEKVIDGCVPMFKKVLRAQVEARQGAFDLAGVKRAFGELGANAIVFVVDRPDLPASLLAVDSGWGLVNVAALAVDGADASKLESRTVKSIARITALVAGAASSRAKTSVLRPATTLEELDELDNYVVSPDALMNILFYLPKLGITQSRMTTYKKLCEEGTAPAPTNEYQKAIWEKVHAVPKNPMKIEFDPKKGR